MIFKRIKNAIYRRLVERHPEIKYAYQLYVNNNKDYHKKHRLKSWIYMRRLNRYYKGKLKVPPPSPIGDVIDILNLNLTSQNGKPVNPPPHTPPTKGAPPVAYLYGAESLLRQWSAPHIFVKSLLKYDVVSFDIFDTLIFRPFVKPSDLFMLLQERFNYFSFQRIRIEAENKARNIHQALYSNREVNIRDIYEIVEQTSGIGIEDGINAEFECEMDMCVANPYMKRVFDILKSQGKRIIAVSDMYYPREMIERLLESCGFTGFEDIFVSCDVKSNKGSGRMYSIVKHAIGTDYTYVHIGDNYNSDVVRAREAGFVAYHYKNVNDLGKAYRATYHGMSDCIGSAYGGIVNNHLHNGIQPLDPYFEFGFIYGGVYILGFCNWIYQYCKTHQVDKVLFLARDGDIYQKVFNLAFSDIPNEYVLWSRLPSIRISAERDRFDFLLRYISHRKSDIEPISLSGIFSMLGLSYMEPLLRKYGLNGKHYVTVDNEEMIKKLFVENWDEIIKVFSDEQDLAKQYLMPFIEGCKKVAVIDIGWQGSGPHAIKWLVEEKWGIDCKVETLLAAAYSFDHTSNQVQILNNDLNAYIFTRMYNRNLYDYHLSTNHYTNNIMLELFTQACSPTFEKFSSNKNGELQFSFGFCDVENHDKLQKMHDGIIEFAKIYLQTFKKYPFMYNISGYDAYMPFRLVTRNLTLIKLLFSDYVITRNLGYDERKHKLETIGDLFRERKI